jgi:hypothetical protein
VVIWLWPAAVATSVIVSDSVVEPLLTVTVPAMVTSVTGAPPIRTPSARWTSAAPYGAVA